ncbi:MAG TPA: alpha/beta hydrolase fold domain-containing protein, partial [Novosphingobium sp.]|nr:alpha/beta hydrolase fold domain-containing protein [Novosphingobium sp.]
MSKAPVLPPEREGRPPAEAIAKLREQMAQAAQAGAWATTPAPDEVRLGGLRALRFGAHHGARARVLEFHGGGFRLGMPDYCGPFAAALAQQCRVAVDVVQYRLAPEHPFPAGLHDALAALQALAAEPEGGPVVLVGDSAGGGLAASLALLAQAQAIAVAGLVLLSPWLDLTVTAPSYASNAQSDPLFSRPAAELAADLYLQGHDPRDPLVSPLLADPAAFPPTLVCVGKGEVLHDDAVRFHRKLRQAGVDVTLSVIDGMDHVAVLRGMDLPGARRTFAAVAGFVAGL